LRFIKSTGLQTKQQHWQWHTVTMLTYAPTYAKRQDIHSLV